LTLAGLAALSIAGAPSPKTCWIIATSPVPPGKFKAVADIGRQHGITVEAHFAERLPADQAARLLENPISSFSMPPAATCRMPSKASWARRWMA
jgi:hypothetical protein